MMQRLALLVVELLAVGAVAVVATATAVQWPLAAKSVVRHRVEAEALLKFRHSGFDFPLGGPLTTIEFRSPVAGDHSLSTLIAVVDGTKRSATTFGELALAVGDRSQKLRLEVYVVGDPDFADTVASLKRAFDGLPADLVVARASDEDGFAQFSGVRLRPTLLKLGAERELVAAVFGAGGGEDIAWLLRSAGRSPAFRVGASVSEVR